MTFPRWSIPRRLLVQPHRLWLRLAGGNPWNWAIRLLIRFRYNLYELLRLCRLNKMNRMVRLGWLRWLVSLVRLVRLVRLGWLRCLVRLGWLRWLERLVRLERLVNLVLGEASRNRCMETTSARHHRRRITDTRHC